MKNLINLLLFTLTFSLPALSQQSFQLKDSQLSILGTSSIHDWESEVTKVEAIAELQLEEGILKGIKNLKVNIPVEGIKSSRGNIMNKKTYKALKMDEHPAILFQLGQIKSIELQDNHYQIIAEGDLNIAGTSRSIELLVTGKSLPNNEIQFTGEKSFTMTSFNVAPPTAMMGTLKTGDEITVRFDITLIAATEKTLGSD